MSRYNNTRKVEDLDLKTLAKAVEIARKLQAKVKTDKPETSKDDLFEHIGILSKLLEYLILNRNNPNIDISLIEFLEKILGISRSKDKNKEQEEELTEEQKKIRYRQIMYEAYKILNPQRLAGETSFENFIANVLTRGIKIAREYEGVEHECHFTKKGLRNLESYKEGFVGKLQSSGHKGYGRGL